MGWLSRRKQRKERDKRIADATKQLPGSTERIEKALTLPTTCNKRNPFLDRLDPAKEIKPMMRSGRLPSPKPGEKNPFLIDDGQLKDGLAPLQVTNDMVDNSPVSIQGLIRNGAITYTTPSGKHKDTCPLGTPDHIKFYRAPPEYAKTCVNTQKSRWACRGCEYIGECKEA